MADTTGISWLIPLVLVFANQQTNQPALGVPKAKVEFRWLESAPVREVTDGKGIRTTCGPELSYPHKKAVLDNKGVAGVQMINHGSVMGIPGDHFSISFDLSEAARKTLSAAASDDRPRPLAVFIDGKYWSTWYFRRDEAHKFTPRAAYISSKAEAERIVAAFK